MKKLITLLCIICTFTFADTFQTEDNFSVTLPDGWIQIPKEILDEQSEGLAKLSPNIPKQIYDYGFQHTSQENWCSPPYILVQVKNIGRIPSGKLSQFRKFDETSERVSSKVKDAFPDQISDVSINEPTYDSENNMLWVFSTLDMAEGHKVKIISGIKLTEKGMIQMMGYSTEGTYGLYKEVYSEAFTNLSIDESIRYNPQVTDDIPILNGIDWEEVILAGIKGAIICGIIGVATVFSKKKKAKKKPKQEESTPDQF